MANFNKPTKLEIQLGDAICKDVLVYVRLKYANMMKADAEVAASDSFLYQTVALSTMVLARQLGNVLSLTISEYGGSVSDFESLLKVMWPGLRKEMMKGFSNKQWEQIVKQLKQ